MKQDYVPTSIQVAQVDLTALRKLQEKYDLAVAALKDIRTADDDCVCDSGYSANTVAIETITQIEEGK